MPTSKRRRRAPAVAPETDTTGLTAPLGVGAVAETNPFRRGLKRSLPFALLKLLIHGDKDLV